MSLTRRKSLAHLSCKGCESWHNDWWIPSLAPPNQARQITLFSSLIPTAHPHPHAPCRMPTLQEATPNPHQQDSDLFVINTVDQHEYQGSVEAGMINKWLTRCALRNQIFQQKTILVETFHDSRDLIPWKPKHSGGGASVLHAQVMSAGIFGRLERVVESSSLLLSTTVWSGMVVLHTDLVILPSSISCGRSVPTSTALPSLKSKTDSHPLRSLSSGFPKLNSKPPRPTRS